jgi:hypothetical protein
MKIPVADDDPVSGKRMEKTFGGGGHEIAI